ncbi:MAG TPA: aminopeptidase [Cytophagaceae bacterium]|jgi:predicted aminopeptidase|nr:aminopeptidase [Cytophagaceae bacterium]
MKKKRSIYYLFILVLLILIGWNYQLVSYGISQAYGQLTILWNTRSVEEVLKDSAVPDSVKQKIELINEIKKFAFDSLGIKKNENYTSFYDQKNKPILWVITACPPFEMKAFEWEFPLLGSFSYKGYFVHEKALAEEKKFIKEGFDTDVGEVSAWSTLGWLRDPILSSMLRRRPGSLANLIIHELTHGTLYVKSNVDFNENLASFVGDYGARKFLSEKFGADSKEFSEYEKGFRFQKEYSERTLGWAKRLDSLYKKFDSTCSYEMKRKLKEAMIDRARQDLTSYLKENNFYNTRYEKDFAKLNNAYFIDFITYRSQQNVFEEEFRTKFHSKFPAYMNYLKEKYPSL